MADQPSGTVSRPTPNSNKLLYTTANPFEARFGYHRAVRKGRIYSSPFTILSGFDSVQRRMPHVSSKILISLAFIFVSGTTALNPATGEIEHPNSAEAQTNYAIQQALEAIHALNGGVGDVVRVRMFVASHRDTEAVGCAFQAIFASAEGSDVGAAATMIVVGEGGFVDREMLVEVEMDAVLYGREL